MSDLPQRLSQYPLARLRVECRVCGRRGDYSVARLAARHHAEIDLEELLLRLTASCRWQRRPGEKPPKQYQQRCLAFLPDLDGPRPTAPAAPVLKVVGRD